jgi:DNA-binding SARP family transcriptional activator/tetratricopeptide (TPR) repeat protein
LINLRLLGTPSLEVDGAAVLGRSAQRKRIALLAILADAGEPGVSRDRVVGLLWPDSDPGKARRVLSEALYVLKKELGDGVVRQRGENLSLNREIVWTDLWAAREALDAGRAAEAVEVYGGPFLDGFAIEGSAEFEHWADAVRHGGEERHKQALGQLAEEATARGDRLEAVQCRRALAALDPYSSLTAIGLMRALAAAGDRAGALAHARIHAQLLREEFDAEPSPDVEALAEELRETPTPVSPDEGSHRSGLVDPVEPPRASDPVDHPAPGGLPGVRADAGRRRRGRALVQVGALAGVVVLGWSILDAGPTVGPPGPSSDRVFPSLGRAEDPPLLLAVYPVAVAPESEESRAAGAQATQLLRMDLEIGNIRAVDAGVVSRASQELASPGRGRPGEDQPQTRDLGVVAARSGWDLFVPAELVLAGDRIVLEAELWSARASQPIASAHVEGAAESLRDLVAELATGLLEGYAVRSGLSTAPAARMSTTSLEALGEWLRGEEAFLSGRYRAAIGGFEAAIAADPDFAWAWYRLSASYLYSLRFPDAHRASRKAGELAGSLPAHRSSIVRAWDAFLSGRVAEAETGFVRVLEVDPRDPEALFGLAEVRSHYNPLAGRPPEEGRGEFEAVLTVYERHGESVHHLLEFAAREGDWVRFRDLLSRLPADGDQVVAWRAVLAFGEPVEGSGQDEPDREAVRRALEDLRVSDPLVVAIAAARVAAHLHDHDGADQIAALLRASSLPSWRAAGWVVAAQSRAARGDFVGAREALRSVRPLEPTWAVELDALFALLFGRWAPGEWDSGVLANELQATDPETAQSDALLFLVHAGVHDEIRGYLMAAMDIAMGGGSDVDPAILVREARGEGETSVRLAAELAASLRGMVRLADGDTLQAIGEFEFAAAGAGHVGSVERVGLSPFFGHVLDRWQIAGLMALRPGSEEEALLWFSGLTEGFDILMAAPAHLQKGRLLERMGRDEDAVREYQAFVREWSGVEPGSPAAEMVREAESAMLRLENGRSGSQPGP